MLEGTFTLDDFLDQMQSLKKMGPMSGLMGMMPGVPKEVRDVEIEDSHIARIEGIIHSMTASRADRSRHHRRQSPEPDRQGLGHLVERRLASSWPSSARCAR